MLHIYSKGAWKLWEEGKGLTRCPIDRISVQPEIRERMTNFTYVKWVAEDTAASGGQSNTTTNISLFVFHFIYTHKLTILWIDVPASVCGLLSWTYETLLKDSSKIFNNLFIGGRKRWWRRLDTSSLSFKSMIIILVQKLFPRYQNWFDSRNL